VPHHQHDDYAEFHGGELAAEAASCAAAERLRRTGSGVEVRCAAGVGAEPKGLEGLEQVFKGRGEEGLAGTWRHTSVQG
jgi:hypothetical protein